MAAADYDFREIIQNWYAHLKRLGIQNALVLARTASSHDLELRRIPHADNSVNLDAWNATLPAATHPESPDRTSARACAKVTQALTCFTPTPQ